MRGDRPQPDPRAVAFGVAIVAAAAVVPFVASTYVVTIALRMVVLALFALAFNVVFGAADMPSLGHAALFGTGSYAVGLGMARWDWPFPVVVVMGLAAGALLGVVMGVATLRTQGIYLLLLTLAIGQAVWGLAFQQVRLTGGDNGIAGIDRSVLALGAEGLVGFYWAAVAVVAVAAALLYWFRISIVGTTIEAVGMSPSRLRALGFAVGSARVTAFGVSGAFAALAGMLMALGNRFVAPENLAWQLSAEVMLFAILGGASWFAGPVLGVVAVIGTEVVVKDVTDRWPMVLGALYVVTMLFLPDGVLGALKRRPSRPVSGSPRDTGPGSTLDGLAVGSSERSAGPVAGEVAVETVDLARAFGGVRAVDEVSLTVPVGQTRAIIGPNGAGKTTLFNLLSGHLDPSAGRIRLFGNDVTDTSAHRRSRDGLSRTFQLSNLFGELTTLDNVRLAVAGNDPTARRRFWQPLRTLPRVDDRAREVIATFGLEQVATAAVAELAYGQQRVLEIAMALAGEPRVLLLDEPTAGVSRREAEAITAIIADLPADLTVLIVEHDMEVAFALADEVTVLVDGAELVTAPPAAVRQDPEVIRAYLGGTSTDDQLVHGAPDSDGRGAAGGGGHHA